MQRSAFDLKKVLFCRILTGDEHLDLARDQEEHAVREVSLVKQHLLREAAERAQAQAQHLHELRARAVEQRHLEPVKESRSTPQE